MFHGTRIPMLEFRLIVVCLVVCQVLLSALVKRTKGKQMHQFKYLAGYSEQIISQVGQLIAEDRLSSYLMQKYPTAHDVRTDKALYDFTVEIKNEFLRTAQPLSRVMYDGKIHVIQQALGTHTFVS